MTRLLSNVLILSAGIVLTAGCASDGDAGADGGDGSSPFEETGTTDVRTGMDAPPPTCDAGFPTIDVGTDTGPSLDSGHKEAGGEAGSEASPSESGSDAVAESGGDSSKGSDSGVIPTTCAQADTSYGCCAGNVLYYCATSTPTTLTMKACTGTTSACGWDTSKGYYNCVAPPGTADPGGTYPIACE
jgi:hypothetical protein